LVLVRELKTVCQRFGLSGILFVGVAVGKTVNMSGIKVLDKSEVAVPDTAEILVLDDDGKDIADVAVRIDRGGKRVLSARLERNILVYAKVGGQLLCVSLAFGVVNFPQGEGVAPIKARPEQFVDIAGTACPFEGVVYELIRTVLIVVRVVLLAVVQRTGNQERYAVNIGAEGVGVWVIVYVLRLHFAAACTETDDEY